MLLLRFLLDLLDLFGVAVITIANAGLWFLFFVTTFCPSGTVGQRDLPILVGHPFCLTVDRLVCHQCSKELLCRLKVGAVLVVTQDTGDPSFETRIGDSADEVGDLFSFRHGLVAVFELVVCSLMDGHILGKGICFAVSLVTGTGNAKISLVLLLIDVFPSH